MARVARVQLIRREVREYLSPSALEILFAHAEWVAEGSGDLDARDPGGPAYATIMVTIDLGRCEALLREPADAATAARVAELLGENRDVPARLAVMARDELGRIAGVPPDELEAAVEHHTRADGTRILIDGDAVLTRSEGR
jgi:hypothetical protein